MFVKYKKILSYSNSPQDFDMKQDVVIAEKIHGANLSILYTKENNTFELYSRNKKIGLDNFMGVSSIRDELVEKAKNLAYKDIFKEFKTIQIIGELYGNGVQKTPQYFIDQSKKEFTAFDIYVDGERIHNQITTNNLLDKVGFSTLLLKIMTLKEALEYNVDIPSTISECDNPATMEGIVIYPKDDLFFKSEYDVFLIKRKSKIWEEKSKRTGYKSINSKCISQELKEELEIFAQYVNNNRLQNVLSKQIYSIKDFNLLLQDLFADALEDYTEENKKGQSKEFIKLCKNICVPYVKDYILNLKIK